MNDTLIIFLGVTKRQELFWKSYHALTPGRPHDILVAYIDRTVISEITNKTGKVFYESKIVDGKDIPHKAYGGYRYFFNKYKDQYTYFAFISDDVILRSDNWLQKCIEPMINHKKLGWVGTQNYSTVSGCFPNHCRAHIWFAKSEALSKIKWKFKNDHDGEISMAEQFRRAGYFGVQIGHQFDIAYDSLENGSLGVGDGIISCFEKKFFPEKKLVEPYSAKEINDFEKEVWESIISADVSKWTATSPHAHIREKNFITELQGLNGQIYVPSLPIARKHAEVLENPTLHIQILKEYAPNMPNLPLSKKKPLHHVIKNFFVSSKH
jgi:hypothetical protein